MQVELFSSISPGELVQVQAAGESESAFIPDPLPPQWEFPAELWPKLLEATNQLNLLEGIGSSLPEPGILLRPLRDREAIRSSEIEGTYATAKELLLFDLHPRESKSETDPINDQREVHNYRLALEHAEQTELPLGLTLLRELHRILLDKVRGRDRSPGEFRQEQVAIGTTRRFIPPPPYKLIDCLDPFEDYLSRIHSHYHPLVEAFLAHYQFEAIHPFSDGNGRVGRLLMTIMIQKSCGLTRPWLHMSEYFEKSRQRYYDGLFCISTQNAWTPWVEYCLEGVVAQAEATVLRCRQLLESKEEFSKRVQALGGSVRLQGVVDGVFVSPFVRVTSVRDRFAVDYKTAKADVERLAEAGILAEVPGLHPKTYYAPKIFDIAYEGLGD